MVTLFNIISSDGYIARENGSEDFIPDELWPEFLKVCEKYDALIMGRKTYDAIQKYDKELLKPFQKLKIKKIIITRQRDFVPKAGYVVAHSPKDALSLEINNLVSSGPTLNSYLIKNGVVDKIILYKLPVTIGAGIKPFNTETKNIFIPMDKTKNRDGIIINVYRLNN